MRTNYFNLYKIILGKKILIFFYLTITTLAFAQTFAIPPKFDYAGTFSEGLAIVTLKGNKFYIDTSGKIVLTLPKKFETAYDFSEGYARVISEGKFGFIDKSGRTVIDFKYENASDFKNGISIVSFDKLSISNMFSDTHKSGAINKKGDFIVNPYLTKIFDFNDGHAAVNFGGMGDPTMGAIDTNGNVTILGKFEYITKFNEGLASALTSKNGWGVISHNGTWIIPPKFDALGEFSEGLAVLGDCNGMVHKPYDFKRNNKCRLGYIDKTGKTIIAPQFTGATSFSESLASVSFSVSHETSAFSSDENIRYGYINTSGKLVVDPIYSRAEQFKNGVAAVNKIIDKRNTYGKWGYIDKNGKAITQFIYDYAGSVSEGLAVVKLPSGKWGFLKFQ